MRQRMGTSLTPPHEVFSMCRGYTTAKKRSGYLHDNRERGRERGGERGRENVSGLPFIDSNPLATRLNKLSSPLSLTLHISFSPSVSYLVGSGSTPSTPRVATAVAGGEAAEEVTVDEAVTVILPPPPFPPPPLFSSPSNPRRARVQPQHPLETAVGHTRVQQG